MGHGLMTEVAGVAPTGLHWEILLNYEQEIRKAMVRKVQHGVSIGQALTNAMEDDHLKSRYLLAPLHMEAIKRPHASAGSSNENPHKKSKAVHSGLWGKGGSSNGGGKGGGEKGGKRAGKAGGRRQARWQRRRRQREEAAGSLGHGHQRRLCVQDPVRRADLLRFQ